MSPLDDEAVSRLRRAADLPDLTGTKYTVVRRLERGGMGTVYLAHDADLDREVALKVLSLPDPSGELAARMLGEARHLARLEHPNIVPVHDVGRLPDGRVFYVMKLVRGKRLDAWRGDGASRPALLRLFQKVCGAVAFAHAQGVIHRDLKPENVMVGSFGEALVMDWGVAKAIGARAERREPPAASTRETGARTDSAIEASTAHPERTTRPQPSRIAGGAVTAQGAVIGTPAYMSPEQARGEVEGLDARTDVYALGAILYHLLAGRPPFEGDSPAAVLGQVMAARPQSLRAIDPSIPKPLVSICAKAMAAEPAGRYETAQQMADDVDRLLDGLPVSAHRETLLEKIARLTSKYRFFILIVAAYLIMRVMILLLAGR